jgi:ribosomal protein S14
MLFSRVKSLKIKNLFLKKEVKLKINKFIFINLLNYKNNINVNKNKFILINYLKQNKIFNRTKNRLTNRCILTNRSHCVYRKLGFSRIVLREMMQFGIIPGYKKSVW